MVKKIVYLMMIIMCVIMYKIAYSQEEQNNPKSATAEENNNQCQSEGFNFSQGALVLNNSGQHQSRIFQIQNMDAGQVKLDHFTETDPGMSAGWASSIDSGMISLLAMNQPNFAIKCMINNPPVEWGLIDCRRVLQVCAITPKQSLGSFWIAENKPLAEILKTLRERRITD